MTLPAPFDEWDFLHDIIIVAQNKRVNDEFSDVVSNINFPDITSAREALAYACLLQSDDTDTMTILRLYLFYLIAHKARDYHPSMFAIPEENYYDSVVTKPQVVLLFCEKRLDAVNNNRAPIKAKISFRLMGETSQSITQTKVDTLTDGIWNTLASPTVFKFDKGDLKGSYIDKENGYQFIITGKDVATIKSVVTEILKIQSHTPNWDLLTVSDPEKAYPTTVGTQTILGKAFKEPTLRPSGTVHFARAELKLYGMSKDILMVCGDTWLNARCKKIFIFP